MSSSSDFVRHRNNRASVPLSDALGALAFFVDAVSATGTAIHRGIVRALNALHRGIAFRRTVSTLSSLDDRTLRDIGITRADITRVAEEACECWK